jgi:Flp pilus assembly protein TadB
MAATRTRRTSARGPLKGRAVVAIGLAVFVVVTAAAVWRRSTGHATERAMNRLHAEQRTLRAEQQTLENDLRRATSRRMVVEEAERRLGMHVATEAQTRLLPASGAVGADAASPDSTP